MTRAGLTIAPRSRPWYQGPQVRRHRPPRRARLGQTCPQGYFYEEGAGCLVQTQQLATNIVGPGGTTFGPATQYYPGIYGPASTSPVGVTNITGESLRQEVKSALEYAGHSVDCKRVQNCAGNVCVDEQMCSIDGGAYDRSAYAMNAAPGVLLVELGAKVPVFPAIPAGMVSTPTTQAPSGTPVTTGHGSGHAEVVTVALENVSRPGQPFRVGDKFRAIVNGSALMNVTVSAVHDGRSLGSTIYGQTDSAGRFTLSGVFSPSDAGQWQETWQVGHLSRPLSFIIAPSSSTDTPAAAITTAPPPPGPTAGYLDEARTFLTRPLFDGVQVWMLALGLAAGGLLLAGGRR